MDIFLTYDYELFFGDPTGSAEKCILEPTNQLRAIAQKTAVKMVFFIDVGYIKKLQEFATEYQGAAKDLKAVTEQVKTLVQEGHDCQLHIHPHWEDCRYTEAGWEMITERYKLVDFEEEEIERIVLEYQSILKALTGKVVTSYRAGGWCLQPFSKIRASFEKAGLKIDSTVFKGGHFTAGNYYYDFRNTPQQSKWKFSDDLTKEDVNGPFWEYPIGNHYYKPLFFWRLFLLGRLNPKDHKPIGNGYPMKSPGLRKKMLTTGMNLSASSDGYFVTKLQSILKKHEKLNFNELVIIGHPKANTNFALKKLEQFIQKNKDTQNFTTFAALNVE